jgi:methionine-rich copper-binding protein CopC
MPKARNARTTTGLITLCIAASLWAAQAQAHAKLVSADPAPSATVAAPKAIHLEFSEEIAKKFSSFKLTDTDGYAVAVMTMKAKDAKSLEAMPNAALSPGVYTVSWTAVSTDDGHKMTGSYSFTVQ